METLGIFIKFLKEIFPSLLAYKAGSDSKENEQLREENEKLKKYQKIDDDNEHSSDDAYIAGLWK